MTDLELFNLALSQFDKQLAQSDLDATSPAKEVRLCRQFLPMAKRKAMREFDWSFLLVKIDVDLADDDGGGHGFSHGYLLPTNLLKLVHASYDLPYLVTGGRLYTDAENPTVYGVMQDMPLLGVPEDFYELIAYALAFQIASMLAPEGKTDQAVLQKYTWALNGLISAECHNNRQERRDE